MATVKDTYIHGPIQPWIKLMGTAEPMEQYLCVKANWTKQIFETIDWAPTKSVLNNMSVPQRPFLAKTAIRSPPVPPLPQVSKHIFPLGVS